MSRWVNRVLYNMTAGSRLDVQCSYSMRPGSRRHLLFWITEVCLLCGLVFNVTVLPAFITLHGTSAQHRHRLAEHQSNSASRPVAYVTKYSHSGDALHNYCFFGNPV